jgi:glycosyltransferase involved in cell wall biosynthesis
MQYPRQYRPGKFYKRKIMGSGGNNTISMNVVYVGESGFPYGFAAIQRALLLCKGLVEAGARVLVISRRGVHVPHQYGDLQASGCYDGVTYVYTSGTPFRAENPIQRIFHRIKGLLREITLIRKTSKTTRNNVMLVSTMDFHDIVFYHVLARMFGYIFVMNYVEYNPAVCKQKTIKDLLNRVLFERYAVHAVDGILSISGFLASTARKISARTRILMVPVLCDFHKFKEGYARSGSTYFLYCGSTAYIDVCEFVLRSFALLDTPSVKLHLVLNGPEKDLTKCRQAIQRMRRRSQVTVFSDLPYPDLVRQYQNATGLLIPIRPNEQDRARFPHKIGEYTASKKPIVTTDIGEITRFFKNGQSAYIAHGYNVETYAAQMQRVLSDPTLARHVAEHAWRIGYEKFHYQRHSESIYSFMLSLQGG